MAQSIVQVIDLPAALVQNLLCLYSESCARPESGEGI